MAMNYLYYCLEFVDSQLSNKIRFFMYTTIIFLIVFKILKYYKSLPPGPWGMPVLGILPFMNRRPPHLVYLNLSNKYGDVFSVQMGSNLIVCLGSSKLMKELFSRIDSTGRPDTPLNNLLEGYGIITSQGELWKRQRIFLHEKFRALGVKLWPNSCFEEKVNVETEELIYTLRESKGQPVNPSYIFGRHIHNIICQIIMSYRFEADDRAFSIFNDKVSRSMRLFGLVLIGEHLKVYLKLPGKRAVIDEIRRNLKDISRFHQDHINERIKKRAKLPQQKEPADLLDYYLDKLEEEKTMGDKHDKRRIFPNIDPEKQIVQVMNDLFSAGMETSVTSLRWTFVMLLKNPKVTEKVRTELRRVVPLGARVTLAHRTDLSYIEAVLVETMRIVSIVPLGTTHVNTADWKIGKYHVPAGSHIIPLINKMNMDPELYPDPEQFKPERFIHGGQFCISESLQFGTGQRMCLGNSLARMELFLFLANVMNNYEFSMPEGEVVPPLDGILGATHAPLPFNLCFTPLKD